MKNSSDALENIVKVKIIAMMRGDKDRIQLLSVMYVPTGLADFPTIGQQYVFTTIFDLNVA